MIMKEVVNTNQELREVHTKYTGIVIAIVT